jgi:hypothetical protein
MHRIGAAVFFCAAILPQVVYAQDAAAGKAKPAACPVTTISNTTDGTKAELACEWLNLPTGGTHAALDALQLYTTYSKKGITLPASCTPPTVDGEEREAKKLALCILIAGAPGNEDLYDGAAGDPNDEGRPGGQGLTAFLDLLSEANTLNTGVNKTSAVFKGGLLDQAKMLIDIIFLTGTGKRELAKISASFTNPKSKVALFQLLKAYPATCPGKEVEAALSIAKAKSPVDNDVVDAAERQKARCHEPYPKNLEILRAAFEVSSEDLAKLVAAKIAPAAK